MSRPVLNARRKFWLYATGVLLLAFVAAGSLRAFAAYSRPSTLDFPAFDVFTGLTKTLVRALVLYSLIWLPIVLIGLRLGSRVALRCSWFVFTCSVVVVFIKSAVENLDSMLLGLIVLLGLDTKTVADAVIAGGPQILLAVVFVILANAVGIFIPWIVHSDGAQSRLPSMVLLLGAASGLVISMFAGSDIPVLYYIWLVSLVMLAITSAMQPKQESQSRPKAA